MAKIYVSYNHLDIDVAKQIAEGLKELGHEITLDVETVGPGQEWQKVLNEALRSSEIFLSLLTFNSIKSSFVLSELGAARAISQSSKNMLVIPVVFNDVPAPPVIQDLQYLRTEGKEMDDIILFIDRAINAFLSRRAAEEKKEVEVKERIESNAASYIGKAIASLKQHEGRNRRRGDFWYYLGFLTLLLGIVFGFYSIAHFITGNDQQWIHFAYIALKTAIVIGLLIACSKYSFTLGQSYMSEALKSADRIHAISFGEFYLNAFGEQAQWAELKEAFQHWNINTSSSFSSLGTDSFDPKFIEAVIEIAKIVTKK